MKIEKKKSQNESCKSCKHAKEDGTCGAEAKGADALDAFVKENLEQIKTPLLVMSGKGGVGKSTVAVNLATGLARRGFRTGLLDVDLHGPSVPGMLGLGGQAAAFNGPMIAPVLREVGGGPDAEPLRVISISFFARNRDEAVIWRGPMKIGAIKQFLGQVCWGELDYLVVDSPPGTGDEPLSVAQMIPDAKAIVVTTPQEVSLADVRKSISFCRTLNMPVLGVIENMSGFCCPHCRGNVDLFKSGGGEKMAAEADVPFLGKLPIDPGVVAAGDEGKPAMAADDYGPAAEAMDKIVSVIVTETE